MTEYKAEEKKLYDKLTDINQPINYSTLGNQLKILSKETTYGKTHPNKPEPAFLYMLGNQFKKVALESVNTVPVITQKADKLRSFKEAYRLMNLALESYLCALKEETKPEYEAKLNKAKMSTLNKMDSIMRLYVGVGGKEEDIFLSEETAQQTIEQTNDLENMVLVAASIQKH